MEDNPYNFGVTSGYNQVAPGRDTARYRQPGRPGRPPGQQQVINNAIAQGPPVPPDVTADPGAQPTFQGAQQTIGAPAHTAPPQRRYMQAPGAGIADVSAAVSGQQPPPAVAPAPSAPSAPPVDQSQWNTKGFAAPQLTAQNFGNAPSGWDQAKWADPNQQQPKYVVGRLEMEASGGDGVFDTPEEKQAAVDAILKAYPGATFDGKDMVQFPGGGAPVDVFEGAGTGKPRMSFAPQDGNGGGATASGQMSPLIQNAITGSVPTEATGGTDYVKRLRQQVLGSLAGTPELLALAKQNYGI